MRVALIAASFLLPAVAHADAGLCKPSEGAPTLALVESFPARGTAGHLATLQVKVPHGKGETLLPRGVQLDGDSAGVKALAARGFATTSGETADAGATASVTREEVVGAGATQSNNDRVISTLTLPLVLLPSEPGTVQLELPELPLSLVQASGQVVTVCTAPHAITVVDPTASTPDAKPRDNPPPLRQREHWQALENVLWGLLAALISAALGAVAYRAWTRRPKPVPPPPPPRPAWELALEALDQITRDAKRDSPEHSIDRCTDVLRTYLGKIYAFDGLESTTEEVLQALKSRGTEHEIRVSVAQVLRESDLVKFASAEAPADGARDTLEATRALVLRTIPAKSHEATEVAP